MSPFEELESQIEQLRRKPAASQGERRTLLLEIEEFVSSADYQSLSADERQRIQAARKELIAERTQSWERHSGETLVTSTCLAHC